MTDENSKLREFADSAFVKLIHYGITVILVPIMFNIQGTLIQIQVTQAITTNDISSFKAMKQQRDAEMSEVHRVLGEMQSRLAVTEATLGAIHAHSLNP